MFFILLTARPARKPFQSSLHPPLSWHSKIGDAFIHSFVVALQHVRVKLRLPILFSQLSVANLRRRHCRRQRLQFVVAFRLVFLGI